MSVARFPVDGGHVLVFARSLGDFTAPYTDEQFERDGLAGIAAPPTFLQASAHFDPDYGLRPRPDTPWWGSGATSSDHSAAQAAAAEQNGSDEPAPARATVLHAEQRFEFVRPVRVGDVLSATQRAGRSWEKISRRGGRLMFSESITEYYSAGGDLVATATAVAVQTYPEGNDQ
jgi:hypothetical protein